jgi:hypothetical protein
METNKNSLKKRLNFLAKLFFCKSKERCLYFTPQSDNGCAHWRNGRAVECGSLENFILTVTGPGVQIFLPPQ